MTTITSLRLWRDTGYTEGCLEVPSFSDSLPSPDVVLSNLNPVRDRLFSEVRVPLAYEDIYDMCYLEAVFDMNNGADVTFYGWIDSVTCTSDTTDRPVSAIRWHIDDWRTFASKAFYGSGMVRRRPVSPDMPPQDYPYRFRTAVNRYLISSYNNTHIWWAFVRRNVSDSSNVTTSTWMVWPVSILNTDTNLKMEAGGYLAPSLDELSSGSWDESLKINPEEVSFVGVSPIPPCDYSGNGTTSNITLNPSSSSDWSARVIGTRHCWVVSSAKSMEELSIPFNRTVTTTDTIIYKVCGFDGEPIGALPWGISFDRIIARNILSSNSLNIQLRFIPVGMENETIYSNVMGGVFTAVCPTLELGSNAWSSYVYSGSRQAEIAQRSLNTDAEAIKGRINTSAGTISGATSGATMGAMGGPMGIAGGALLGAVGSFLGGTISTEGIYNYEKNTYNDRIQRINDYATSHQASVQRITGSGTDFCVTPYKGMTLIKMENDDYSVLQREHDLTLYGCTVSEPTGSCQSLIQAGGPLQIDNLIVTGDIPSHAKAYLRDRFAKGVRII